VRRPAQGLGRLPGDAALVDSAAQRTGLGGSSSREVVRAARLVVR
jgi:hypothetical protein